jgi:hypothetical protein
MSEDEQETEAEIWRELFALADLCQPTVTKYTVCIYAHQDTLKPAGTGVLLRVGEKYFLVSAAHVMDFTFYHQLQFYASVSTTPSIPVPLLFERRSSSARPKELSTKNANLRDDDPLDISIAEFKQESVDALRKRYRFLQVGDLDPSALVKGDGVYVFGFPEALTQPSGIDTDLETFPLGYVTTPLQDPPEARDEKKDILLYYPEASRDAAGNPTVAPSPSGLSGCGIWRLSHPPKRPCDTQPSEMRLVGIQHRWRPKRRYLVGTSAARIVEMLWNAYPELHPSLKLVR